MRTPLVLLALFLSPPACAPGDDCRTQTDDLALIAAWYDGDVLLAHEPPLLQVDTSEIYWTLPHDATGAAGVRRERGIGGGIHYDVVGDPVMAYEVRVFYRDSTCEILIAADTKHVAALLERAEERCAKARRDAGRSRYAWDRATIHAVAVLRERVLVGVVEILENDTKPALLRLELDGAD